MNTISGADRFELLVELIKRNKFIPIPPSERNYVSHQQDDFIGQGIEQHLRPLVREGLRPPHSLLDIGCGIGRTALPMTQYLDGNYFGLDVNLSGIAWCHENITTRYPNFEFAVINARNPHYKHRAEYGQESATQAPWPIPPNRRFDYACAFSLFTHLTWDETQHYLRAIASKLKRGGRFVSTWFLVDEAAREGIRAGQSLRDFNIDVPGPMYTFRDATNYFKAIAYDADAVRAAADEAGLAITKFTPGGWHVNQGGQDMLVMDLKPAG